ncbi:MAG: hemolysin family protein [Candidatus Acidiferrales bacterium]
MPNFYYTLGILGLAAGLVVFAYLDRIYRELGRLTAGRVRAHLELFETEIEPRFRLDRRHASLSFSLLARLWLVLVAVLTARGIFFFVPRISEELLQLFFFLGAEVVIAMFLFPSILLVGTTGRWLLPLIPVVRVFVWLVWPVQAALEFSVSVLHLPEESPEGERPAEHEALEALVEAAQEEGILQGDRAHLIEQVMEFSDKRVREVMTPRPDVVSIQAAATVEELRQRLIETRYSRLPVYENSLDEIIGVAYARDIMAVPERDAPNRIVREFTRPALFVPETKYGSELLKEMQRKNQQMAVVIDEYGLMAGIVTVEDLVEEIVGEIGEEDRQPAPDVVRESADSMVLRGSVPVEKVRNLFGIDLEETLANAGATTIAGLLNNIAGHVPRTGESIEYDGLTFDVLEANQRKVLRLRARRRPTKQAASTAHPA